MQSENFDKRIKDLLSQRPPGHDNPAWDKMEPLLDKHLPQEKKDNRRIIFFLLFTFLLLGGGAFIFWQNKSGHKDNNNIVSTKPVSEKTGIETPKTNTGSSNKTTGPLNEGNPKNTGNQAAQQSQEDNTEHKTAVVENNVEQTYRNLNKPDSKKNKWDKNSIASKNEPLPRSIEELNKKAEADNKSTVPEELTKADPHTLPQKNQEQLKETEVTKQDNKTAADQTKEQRAAVQKPKPGKQKNNKSFSNNFFVTASAGPDFSTVSGDAGKVQLAWGGGIGYQVSKKFSIRTGFYVTRKIYTADPEDYHPPYNLWQYYPNLKNIEANCKVYEIPIVIDYTISNKNKNSWFVSAGLSSLLMKEETYDYYYKPNSSPNYITYSKTIKDQNKHYFSVLDLSGGYTRALSNQVSLRAEPYVKIAMSGIGYGKVDLNSGGVLVSAIIRPFAPKK